MPDNPDEKHIDREIRTIRILENEDGSFKLDTQEFSQEELQKLHSDSLRRIHKSLKKIDSCLLHLALFVREIAQEI